ncbi:nitronate monooxygenase [Streptomyces flavofungini]|uniref:nitronate monooxygenase n=1 Tax=Streptomyces flavofungini TaxID=68200 RepID=UPI0034DE9258
MSVWERAASAEAALRAVEDGVEVVVAQGWEAGGHNYGGLPAMVGVPAVVDAVEGRALVLAAGGITDGRQAAAALCPGADGVWVGTLLVASQEAHVHPEHQRRLIAAQGQDTVVVLPTSQATPHLVRRVGMKVTMTVGPLLLSAGLFVISRLDVGSGYLPFLGGLILAGFGLGLSGAVGASAITGSLGRGQQGVASAMNDTTREVGSAVGIALMGSIYGSHYRSHLPDSLDRLPAQAAGAARDSAAAGLHVADQLGTRGAALADDVRSAFMDGLSASLIAVSIIVLAAAIGCLFRAPKTPPTSD